MGELVLWYGMFAPCGRPVGTTGFARGAPFFAGRMEENPLISVIVLNWNGRPFLEQCLGSILAQTYHPLEIILVDNGSTDGSLEFVKETCPDVKVIANGTNLGYGGGNNVGIQSSRGQYVMILNNDTRLDLACIEELKRSIEKKDRYGACASKILFEHAGLRIDAAGLVVCPDGLAIGRGRWDREDRYDTETEVFCASGCACLFRREMLEDIGLYDEDFFAYGEDTDLGWRATTRGLEMHLQSESRRPPFALCQFWDVFPFQGLSGRKKSDLGLREELPSAARHPGPVLHSPEICLAGVRCLHGGWRCRTVYGGLLKTGACQSADEGLPYVLAGTASHAQEKKAGSRKETNF